jgi:hypothetical protein
MPRGLLLPSDLGLVQELSERTIFRVNCLWMLELSRRPVPECEHPVQLQGVPLGLLLPHRLLVLQHVPGWLVVPGGLRELHSVLGGQVPAVNSSAVVQQLPCRLLLRRHWEHGLHVMRHWQVHICDKRRVVHELLDWPVPGGHWVHWMHRVPGWLLLRNHWPLCLHGPVRVWNLHVLWSVGVHQLRWRPISSDCWRGHVHRVPGRFLLRNYWALGQHCVCCWQVLGCIRDRLHELRTHDLWRIDGPVKLRGLPPWPMGPGHGHDCMR